MPLERPAFLLAVGVACIYIVGYFLEYSASPLGLVAVLDGREMLRLASDIAAGQLAAEPFFRAMLYPFVLSPLVDTGDVLSRDLLQVRLFNFLLHVANAILVGALSWQIWRRRVVAVTTGLVWCVYPVALFFASDPLDVTFALTLLLTGLVFSAKSMAPGQSNAGQSKIRYLVAAAFALSLAAAARPQLYAVVLAWSAAVVYLHCRDRVLIPVAGAVVGPAIALALALGTINLFHGGEFRVLPWQGAYDLWSANRPGAHGAYYVQQRPLFSYHDGQNPARAESIAAFEAANPSLDPSIREMTRYWQHRLWDSVTDAPADQVTLLLRKAHFLLGNFEQYNNKTYVFHKARSTWLRWNPLCWGLLLAGAAAGLVCGWQHRQARLLAFVSAAYAAALLVSYVSARFRLPLAPLLLVLAGGAFVSCDRKRRFAGLSLAVLLALTSFYPLPREWRERTFIQDELLIARAAHESRHYAAAITAADAAHRRDPLHAMALELRCVARFNGWLESSDDTKLLPAIHAVCGEAMAVSDVAVRVVAHMLWLEHQQQRARALWQDLVRRNGPEQDAVLAALIHSRTLDPATVSVNWSNPALISAQLLLALADSGDKRALDLIEQRLTADEIRRQRRAIEKLFP